MKTTAWIIIAIGVVTAGGCLHEERSVNNPDPAVKIPAIKEAVAKNDRRVIPQLVKDLDNDDSAIRFYSIDALHDLTHQDFGYCFFDDADHRKAAVEKWQKWLAAHP
ncbi:MAG TPA: hypothetical protein VFE47_05460 [Tepidisphaeraceae bacterium]|jgi:uncharacterized membrane protein YvbJ|nr:hypothetical protein [Tepidisphaeraceae bacterium]